MAENDHPLDPAQARALLPRFLAASVVPERASTVEHAVAALLDETDEAALDRALAALSTLGREYRLYPADPFARRLSRAYMGCLLLPGSAVQGLDHLRRARAEGPVLLVGNHRSYVDTQITDALLAASDPALADRLVTVAGPKVYADLFRRVAALGLSTIQTAQSASVATPEAQVELRERARIAAATVAQAEASMKAGDLVLLYPEGTRTRTGEVGPFLRGAERYARLPGLRLLPLALTGGERIYPIDAPQLSAAVARLRIGPPLDLDGLSRDERMERARAAVVALLDG